MENLQNQTIELQILMLDVLLLFPNKESLRSFFCGAAF